MRVLCCLDGTNAESMRKAAAMLTTTDPVTFGILYVIDTGPRHEMEHTRERFLRPPHPPPREHRIREAEQGSSRDILEEGRQCFPNAEALRREGRPEREIVNTAAEWQADLVMVCPRAEYGAKPILGPKSVGHVARFVLDHAPCPVLLVRPIVRDQFPLAR
jgi:nucleotide-binding universal stress UspA family protein